MEFLQTLFSENVVSALGWTVLHSVWQGVAIAVVLGIFLHLGRGLRSEYKYLVSNMALFACLILPVVTFFVIYEPHTAVAAGESLFSNMVITLTGNAEQSVATLEPYIPVIVNIWFFGFVILLLRLTGGYVYLYRLKESGLPVSNPEVLRVFNAMLQKSGLRKVTSIVQSARVSTPAVIGYFRPVIIIPISMVNQLSYQETEAVLAHELAHIMRHDYLLNVIQSFIEAALYFNPAVWWISNQIRTIREHCCDDMAIRLTGDDQFTYVKSLVRVQELSTQLNGHQSLALSFSGTSGKMLDRVRRILKQPQKNVFAMEKLIFSGLLLVLFISVSAFNHIDETNTDYYKVEMVESASSEYAVLDTIPEGRKIVEERITIKEDGKEYKAVYNNGELTSLVVDGAKIPPLNYNEFSEVLRSLRMELEPVKNDKDRVIRLNGGIKFLTDDDESEDHEENIFHIQIGDAESIELTSEYLDNGTGRIFIYSSDDESEDGEENIFRIQIGDHEEPTILKFNGDQEIQLEGDQFHWDNGTIKIISDGEIQANVLPRFNLNMNELGEGVNYFFKGLEDHDFHFNWNDHESGDFDFHFDQKELEGHLKSTMEKLRFKMDGNDFEWDEDEVNEKLELALERVQEALEGNNQRLEQIILRREMTEQQREEMKRKYEEAYQLYNEQLNNTRHNLEIERGNLRQHLERAERERDRGRDRDRDRDRWISRNDNGDFELIISEQNTHFGPNFQQLVEKEMLNDGLIDDTEDYTLKLQEGKLKVNGKRQSQELYEKYKDLWEDFNGSDISETKFSINKKS